MIVKPFVCDYLRRVPIILGSDLAMGGLSGSRPIATRMVATKNTISTKSAPVGGRGCLMPFDKKVLQTFYSWPSSRASDARCWNEPGKLVELETCLRCEAAYPKDVAGKGARASRAFREVPKVMPRRRRNSGEDRPSPYPRGASAVMVCGCGTTGNFS